VGSTEHTFYVNTLKVLGLRPEDFTEQHDRSGWPAMKEAFARSFATRTREQWVAAFEGTETCFSPVLSLAEAPNHAHQRARSNFVEVAGVMQPAPAPRFSRSQVGVQGPPPEVGQHTDEVLREWGFSDQELQLLRLSGGV
jgi:alpha-methylacyl-CoA racemase